MSSFVESFSVRHLSNELQEFVNKPEEGKRNLSGVILGSFKFHDEINQTIDEFTNSGVTVLAPSRSEIINPEDEFPILASDLLLREKLESKFGKLSENVFNAMVERIFIQTIGRAGFVYIIDRGGYAGVTVAGELGKSMGANIPIYSSEPLNEELDENEGYYSPTWIYTAQTIKVRTVDEVVEMAKQNKFDVTGYEWCGSITSPWWSTKPKFISY